MKKINRGKKSFWRGKLGVLAIFTFITMAIALVITTRTWAQPFAYVTNLGSGTVSAIDVATNSVIATINVEARPYAVAITPDATRAYVTHDESSNLSVIDTNPDSPNFNTIVATISDLWCPSMGVAITPDGKRAYVTGKFTGTVSVIDTDPASPTFHNVIGTISGLAYVPSGVAITPNGTRAYVTHRTSFDIDQVSVIDTDPTSLAYHTIIAIVRVGHLPSRVAITPDGTRAYVTNPLSNAVSVVNTGTNSVIDTIGVDTPEGVAIAPDGSKAYVTKYYASSVAIIDTDPTSRTFHTVLATVGVGGGPDSVAITPDGNRAYVANWYSGVSVIDIGTNTVIATVGVGGIPVSVAITPAPLNTPPVANDQSVTTNKNIAITITLIATDADGDPLTYSIVAGPSHGTLGTITGATVTYTPASGYTGSDSFTFKANDGRGDSNTATVSIRVNAPPVANDQFAYVTNLNSGTVSAIDVATNSVIATINVGARPYAVAITPDATRAYVTHDESSNLSVIDTNPDSPNFNTIVATISDPWCPSMGVAITPDGKRAYVTGIYSQSVSVIDTDPASPTFHNVIGTIFGLGYTPSGVAITPNGTRAYVTHGTPSGIAQVSVIDTDPTSPAYHTIIAIVMAWGPPYGVAITPDGTRAYVTNLVSNAVSVVNTGTNGVVDTIGVDSPLGVAIAPDGSKAYVTKYYASSVAIIDTDPTSPTFHTVLATVGVGGGPNSVAITPDGNRAYVANWYSGTVSVIDIGTNTVIATVGVGVFPVSVAITPAPLNTPPVANNQSVTTNKNTPKPITLVATDPEGDPLTYSIVAGPSHGTLGTLTGATVTYTPASGYSGSDSFTFKANDGTADSNTATVSIKVNAPPVANNQSVVTNKDVAKAITLTATDADGDPLTYSIVSGPSHGTLGTLTGATVTYTPASGYTGSDSFTFKANDGSADSNTATVFIKVNAPPVANNQSVTTNMNTAKAITLTALDAEGDPLIYSIVAGPSHGTLSGTPSNLTYTPASGYSGADSFTFKVNDGNADSNTATVSIKVNAPPVANDQSVTTNKDVAKAITLTATDPDGDSLTYSIVAGPSHGTLGTLAGATVTYTPPSGYTGSDSFTFKANDGSADSNTAIVSITVTATVCTAPTIVTHPQSQAIQSGQTAALSVTASGTAPLNYQWYRGVSGDTSSPVGTNASSYTTPALTQATSYWVRVSNSCGSVDSNTATITINAQLPGDCNGDGWTTIDEVQKAINQFLGIASVEPCCDLNGNGQVTIDEVQKVINAFLGII